MNLLFYRQKGFCRSDLKPEMGRLFRITWWAQHNHKSPYKGTEGDRGVSGHVTTEVDKSQLE